MPLIFQQLPLKRSRCKCLPYLLCLCPDCARCLAGDTRSFAGKTSLLRQRTGKTGIQENSNRNCGNRVLYCGDELLRLSHYYSCFPHRHYDVDGLQAMGTHTGYCAAVNGNPLVAVCRSVTGAIACRHIFRITGPAMFESELLTQGFRHYSIILRRCCLPLLG